MTDQNKPPGLPTPEPVDPELRIQERLKWLGELPEKSKVNFASLSKREVVLYTRGSIELCICSGSSPGKALSLGKNGKRDQEQLLCKRCGGKGYFFVSRG